MGLDYFAQKWGEDNRDKLELHYLGCRDAEQTAKAKSETLRLVSCSNVIPLKRVGYIIDGIALLPENLKIRWDHFGDGSELEVLKKKAEDIFGSHISWEFHGRVPNHEIEGWYHQLDPDLFLTTTSTEGGVPVSIQEAFAMGIPAIGTAVGGVPELVIDGQTGYLLPENMKPEELTKAIVHFVNLSVEEKLMMSENARKLWAELYDAEHNSDVFVNVLKEMLKG